MDGDSFLKKYDPSELEVAAEFLTTWLPFLAQDLCDGCADVIRRRVAALRPAPSEPINHITPTGWTQDPEPSNSIAINQIVPTGWVLYPEPSTNQAAPPVSPPKPPSNSPPNQIAPPVSPPEPPTNQVAPPVEPSRMSWADMAQEEDELEERENEGERGKRKSELSKEERLLQRFRSIKRKKDFFYKEKVRGKIVNVLAGLELHEGVFSPAEQKRIVNFIYELQEKGRRNELGDKTYSEPRKWMRGKGRVTIQFGCNYNYAEDKDGNPPGILRQTLASPIPSLFKVMIRRLVQFRVLPPNCVPDSLIVNIYEPGDCIPPHIDSHDFVRPFCTVSFLSECDILFGAGLGILGPGEFDGPVRIPLPVGSVLVLNGNGADVAKHCVPAVPTKRISITFRKMDESKWPDGFLPEPDLQNIIPLSIDSDLNTSSERKGNQSDFQNGNTNFGGKINEEKTPVSKERSSYEGNGEVSTPQGERSIGALSIGNNGSVPNRNMQSERRAFSRANEGMGALSVGNNGSVLNRHVQSERRVYDRMSEGMRAPYGRNNGSVQSRNAQSERRVYNSGNDGMGALFIGNNGSVPNRNAQSERRAFGRVNGSMGPLSFGNNASVHSGNSQSERSVFSRINEGMGPLSFRSNGFVHSQNSQDERSVFSRLNEGNNSNNRFQQRGNAYFRGRNFNNNRWRNGRESD